MHAVEADASLKYTSGSSLRDVFVVTRLMRDCVNEIPVVANERQQQIDYSKDFFGCQTLLTSSGQHYMEGLAYGLSKVGAVLTGVQVGDDTTSSPKKGVFFSTNV